MVYLIIFLAISAVLGPLMAVLPSKGQRRLASLRDSARQAGIAIAFRPAENVPPRLQRATDNPLISYSVRLGREQSRSVKRDLYVRGKDGWASKSGDAVPSVVQDLPVGAEIVAVGWDDIKVYWDERGGEDALTALKHCFEALKRHTFPP